MLKHFRADLAGMFFFLQVLLCMISVSIEIHVPDLLQGLTVLRSRLMQFSRLKRINMNVKYM
jgi:hypothetical protein